MMVLIARTKDVSREEAKVEGGGRKVRYRPKEIKVGSCKGRVMDAMKLKGLQLLEGSSRAVQVPVLLCVLC